MQIIEKLKKTPTAVYLLLLTVVVGLFAFGASPFYPFNDWVDPNCFFTVGKSLANGKVLYAEIYEQKGPYVYFLHALCYLISNTTFIGVFFFELVNLFLFLLITVKILKLYGIEDKKRQILISTLVCLTVVFSLAFSMGDSVEEFTLPAFSAILYFTLKHIKRNEKFAVWEYLFVGVTAGIIFWSKFNLVGFYLGWFVVLVCLCVRRKRKRELFKAVALIVLGVALATLPPLLYFIKNDAVYDWLKTYLFDNIFVYGETDKDFFSHFLPLVYFLGTIACNPQYSVFIVIGIYSFFRHKEHEEKYALLLIAAVMSFFLFIGGRGYFYYGLPLTIFVVFGYIALVERGTDVRLAQQHKKRRWLKALLAFSCLFFFVINGNVFYIFRPKEKTPEYCFAQYVDEHGGEDASLLTYSFLDSGFYLYRNETPKFKYFCRLNIDLPEMNAELDRYLDDGEADYVVVLVGTLLENELAHPRYKEVLRMQDFRQIELVTYILYEKQY